MYLHGILYNMKDLYGITSDKVVFFYVTNKYLRLQNQTKWKIVYLFSVLREFRGWMEMCLYFVFTVYKWKMDWY